MPVPLLIVGDVIVLLLFVILGRQDHGMAFSLQVTIETAVPFALGWAAALAVFRTYRSSTLASPGKAALYALLTCLLAVPIGLALRALWQGSWPTLLFTVVAFPLVGGFMTVWRFGCALTLKLIGRVP